MPAKFELIAPCFFGCESTAKLVGVRIERSLESERQ